MHANGSALGTPDARRILERDGHLPRRSHAAEVREVVARDAREGAREGAEVAKQLGRDVKATAGRVADKVGDVLTDAAIVSGVKSKFLADSPVVRIDVDAKDGVVTLNGTVGTRAEADRAVSLARETRGVKRVVDNLQVSR